MKYGLIWFLYLDIPIQIARILVIPCFAIGFVSTIGSVLFIVSWVLFAVSLLITLCTCFMHIPSTTKVEKFISQYEKDFYEKQKTEFRKAKNINILPLTCFAVQKVPNFSRRIGKKKIRSTLVMLAWVKINDELWLVCDEQDLWRNVSHVTHRYQIASSTDVQIQQGTPNESGEVKWTLQVAGDRFAMCCKEDYHLRDFIAKKWRLKQSS